MKKICFLTQGVLPVPTVRGGAVETLVEYIIDNNEKKKDFDIDVYTVYDEKAKALESKYSNTNFIHVNPASEIMNKILFFVYRVIKNLFKSNIPYSIESWRMLKEFRKKAKSYDYVIYEAGPTTQIPLIAKIVSSKKIFVHIHWDGFWEGAKLDKIDESFEYLIPVSNYIGKGWMNKTGRSENKVRVLKNCASVEKFTKHISGEEKDILRNSLGIDKSEKVLIFTGRIVEEKGVKELIQAYENINTENVCLLIVGSANFGNKTNSPYEQDVAGLINKSNKHIVFTGFIHQSELYKYYDIADLAIMPSQFQDPAPLVSIETQATGTPLIAMRVGGIPEYVTNESAVLIDKDDNQVIQLSKTIDELINDNEKLKSMSQAGIEQAKKFTTEKYYEDFVQILQ